MTMTRMMTICMTCSRIIYLCTIFQQKGCELLQVKLQGTDLLIGSSEVCSIIGYTFIGSVLVNSHKVLPIEQCMVGFVMSYLCKPFNIDINLRLHNVHCATVGNKRYVLPGFKMSLWNILEITAYKNPQCHLHSSYKVHLYD